MKIGLVAEFNPLHNGHKYLIEKIKEKFENPFIIVAMSSSFVQRGEPAILDKWTRASLALEAGVNLVLEIPIVFSCQNAEIFAKGTLSILKNFNIDYLAFGSESSEENLLNISNKISHLDTNKDYNTLLKSYLDKGYSYINSRNKALLGLNILNKEEIEEMSKSNNILALEYISAIKYFNLNTNIKAFKRRSVNHDSLKTHGNFASASYIRDNIDNSHIGNYLPRFTKEALDNRKIIDENLLIGLIKYDLSFNNNLKNTLDYEDGLENRLLKFAYTSSSLEDLASKAASKRMTKSRIKRSIINSLIHLDGKASKKALKTNYIRILGADERGFKLLSSLDKEKITNFKEIYKLSNNIQEIGQYELKASNLYSILTKDVFNKDFYVNPIIKRS